MSEYPRPQEPEPFENPKQILDLPIAAIYALIIVIGFFQPILRSFDQSLRAGWKLDQIIVSWKFWLVTGFALLAVYLFGLWGFAKGRRYGFVIIAILTSISLIGAAGIRSISAAAIQFPFWSYCIARLFGLIGPKLSSRSNS